MPGIIAYQLPNCKHRVSPFVFDFFDVCLFFHACLFLLQRGLRRGLRRHSRQQGVEVNGQLAEVGFLVFVVLQDPVRALIADDDVKVDVAFAPAQNDRAKGFPEQVQVANLGAQFDVTGFLSRILGGLGLVEFGQHECAGEFFLFLRAACIRPAGGRFLMSTRRPPSQPKDVRQPVLDGGRGQDEAIFGAHLADAASDLGVGTLHLHAFINDDTLEQMRAEVGHGRAVNAFNPIPDFTNRPAVLDEPLVAGSRQMNFKDWLASL